MYGGVYYKLMEVDDKLMVICLGDSDEIDYDQDKFLVTPKGTQYKFETEEAALNFMRLFIKPDLIHDDHKEELRELEMNVGSTSPKYNPDYWLK